MIAAVEQISTAAVLSKDRQSCFRENSDVAKEHEKGERR